MQVPQHVKGVVVHGDARGRELGFPTANVAVGETVPMPANGIYAGWLHRQCGQSLASAISIGKRPTFYEQADVSLLEVHVLDWSGDLYGEEVAIEIIAHLRSELRFDSAEALIEQMDRDCQQARTLLGQ